MRVIAGALKGRRLATPGWEGLRPTSDKLRETLFNVVSARVAGARFFDGYAGTGAIGIEAISRGAAHVTFVDDDRRALRLIAENLGRCGVTDRYVIIQAHLDGAPPPQLTGSFDLAVLDPPYDDTDLTVAVEAVGSLIAPGGLLVLEHARRRQTPESPGSLTRTRLLHSGDSALTFYEPVGGSATAAAGIGR